MLTTHLEEQGRGHPQSHVLGKKLRHNGYTWAIKLDCELNFSPKHPSSHSDLLLHAKKKKKKDNHRHTYTCFTQLINSNGAKWSLTRLTLHILWSCHSGRLHMQLVSHLDILTSYSIWCHLFSCTTSKAVCFHVSASALLSHSGLWHHCSWIQPAGDIQWWKF